MSPVSGVSSFAINVSQGSSSSETSFPPLDSRLFAVLFLGVDFGVGLGVVLGGFLGAAFFGLTLLFFLGGSSSSVSERADSDSEVGSMSSSSKEASSSSVSVSKYLLFSVFSLLRVRNARDFVD